MDRRRLASFVVIAVAGVATIATSPATPSPPPSVDEALSGTVELSAERPVAVREIVVRVTGLDPKATGGRLASVTFRPTADGLIPAVGAGELWTSVVRAEPAESERRTPSGAFRSLVDSQAAPQSLDLTCAEGACEGRFALVLDLVNRTMAVPVSIDWKVAAHVELWSGVPAGGEPVVDVTIDETNSAAALTSAGVSGETASLDLTHRLAMWRLAMTLGDEALARQGWPMVVTARLRPMAKADESPDGGLRGPNVFIEGAGDLSNVGLDAWRSDDTIEFEPFWSCVAGEVCTADYVVGVDLRSVYQDVAVEAGWQLDVRAVAADGGTMPLNVVAEPIPPMPMISASIGGTLVIGPDGDKPPVEYKVTEQLGVGRDLQWDGLRLPTYGILRARATSTGAVSLPAKRWDVRFGPRDFRFGLTLGQDGVFAFIPGGPRCRVPDCDLTEVFSGEVGSDTEELPPGTEITIEWELEIGKGTDVTDGDSKLLMELLPIASPSP